MAEYQSGVCNIDELERKKRLGVGMISFFNAAILTVVALAFPGFTALYAGIFVLTSAGFLGIFQYRQHFCAGLALKQKFDIGETEEVTDPEMVSKDRRKAARIIVQSLLSSALVTSVLYLVVTYF
jgi:predicted nucleic acid-binding Zn ribbon protein